MASNRHLPADALGRRMDKFHNSWERSLEIKLSDLNSGLDFVLNIHGLSGSNVLFEAAMKNKDTMPRIECRYSV